MHANTRGSTRSHASLRLVKQLSSTCHVSSTPTIHMEHNEHLGPDERSQCNDLRQRGSLMQTVTPTGYEPKILGTEEGSEAIPEDLEPKRIELDRSLETDLYHLYHKQQGFMEKYQNTITEDVKVPSPTMFSEKSFFRSQMHSDYDSAERIAGSKPVRSRCACTEVRVCIVQLSCVCLWTS